jgi:hypothetical protein
METITISDMLAESMAKELLSRVRDLSPTWARAELWGYMRSLGSHGEEWSAELNEYLWEEFKSALVKLEGDLVRLELYELAAVVLAHRKSL